VSSWSTPSQCGQMLELSLRTNLVVLEIGSEVAQRKPWASGRDECSRRRAARWMRAVASQVLIAVDMVEAGSCISACREWVPCQDAWTLHTNRARCIQHCYIFSSQDNLQHYPSKKCGEEQTVSHPQANHVCEPHYLLLLIISCSH